MFTRSVSVFLLLALVFSSSAQAEERMQMCGQTLARYLETVDCTQVNKVERAAALSPKQLLINCCASSGCSKSEVIRTVCRK
ncbi:hypothetical protein PRIPAC_96558 [Pristionchus pacificus]|uniref:Uncharacterized protein n=1 Tax=Pristionchus pacificus TaxID=54126 RepID=A0A2A6BJU0_PRIPA|nr:hypothetical protein PRIPAC_96558 [Pristionchus pacificus]|eukprot:PDM66180.1 hypothetical protein PRIPAC_45405 [Pristionchus pacificus]